MTRIVAGMNEMTKALGGVRPSRRVICLLLHFDTNLAPEFVVSEALGNNIRFHHLWVNTVWLSHGVVPFIQFQVTTGTIVQPNYADVQAWEAIVPVRWEGGEGAFGVTPEECHFDFSMDRVFEGSGRRFGVWGIMTGTGDGNLMVAVEIEET